MDEQPGPPTMYPQEERYPAEKSVSESFAGKHLLVTGFTGFVGKVWVASLLTHLPDIARITLMVRGRKGQPATDRVRAIFERSPALRPLRERYGPALHAYLDARLDVVEGDVTKPLCGLDAGTLLWLEEAVDAVVHVAGLTDFMPDPLRAYEANVLGAKHVADVVARTRSRRMIHTSTAYVAGTASGYVPERIDPGHAPNGTRFDIDAEVLGLLSACDAASERAGHPRSPKARRARLELGMARAAALGWPNIYTYTKGLSEHLLAGRQDIRLTIVRPSVVECARRFPFRGWNEGLNTSGPLVWLCASIGKGVPMTGAHYFDVVPVDSVSRGLTLSVGEALVDRAQPVYHIASSDHAPFTFARALELTSLGVRRGYGPKDRSRLMALLRRQLDSVPVDRPVEKRWVEPAIMAAAKAARDGLKRLDIQSVWPMPVSDARKARFAAGVHDAAMSAHQTLQRLKRAEHVWRTYQPFVHDHDYRFATEHLRRRTAQLDDRERARFGWDMEGFDWRSYWLDVEMPGLQRWSFPLIDGGEVEEDRGYVLAGPIGAGGRRPAERPVFAAVLAAAGAAE